MSKNGGRRAAPGSKKYVPLKRDAYQPLFTKQVKQLPPPITNSQLARFFDIAIETLHNWRKNHPEFEAAIREAKDRVDDEVENAFFERARGYAHPAEKIFPPRRGSTKPIRAKYTERYPPDTPAAINWLKNRRPDVWREKEEGDDDAPPPVAVTIEFKDARRKPKED
jgi:hypothetical protein